MFKLSIILKIYPIFTSLKDPGDQLVRQEKVDHQDLQVQVVQEVQLVKEAYVVQLE